MVGRPHNCGEMRRCEEVQKHVFYSSQGHIPVFLPFGSHEHQNGEHDLCSMRQFTGLMPTTSVLNMTVPQLMSLHVFLMVGASGLEPPYAGALMQVILVSVL